MAPSGHVSSGCRESKRRAILAACPLRQFKGHMDNTVRAALVTILIAAPAGHAQTPAINPETPQEARAQEMLSRAKSGQEAGAACGEVDEALATALMEAGRRASSESLERAIAAFRLAEKAGRCLASDRLIGAALNELGTALNLHGDNDGALAAARESQRLHERLSDAGSLAQAHNIIGNVYWGRGEMPAALEEYQRALESWTVSGDRVSQARALNNIGNVHRAFGEFDAALDGYSQALKIFDELGDRRRAAVVTDNIGVAYFWRGEYATALDYSRRALVIQREIGNRVGVGKSLDSIGNIYRALGAYRSALQSFEEALPIRMAAGDMPGVKETSHNIGLVRFSQGEFELAIDAYKLGLRLNRAQHDRSFDAEALRNIGAAAWRLGQPARAAANFRQSLAIARDVGLRTNEGELLHDLGQVALAEGHRLEAERFFKSSLELRRAIVDQAGITESLTSLASSRLAERRYDAALQAAGEAVGNAVAHDQPELLWQAQTAAGAAYRQLGRPDQAQRAFADAINSIERLSSETSGGGDLRRRFFEDKLSPYHELVGLMFEQKRFGDALGLAERSKARVLTQLLSGSRTGNEAALTADETRQRTRLRDAVASLNRRIEAASGRQPADASLPALESSRRTARDELARFESTLLVRHPEISSARGAIAPFTLADAQPLVADPTRAIIEFVVADDRTYALLLTNDGAGVAIDGRAIPIDGSTLGSEVERFRHEIGSRDYALGNDARSLYNRLLGPFAQRLSGRSHLIVVPDGVLWNLPFQALLSPQGYLVESAAVSYAPSITTLREIGRLPHASAERTVLAMGLSEFERGSGLEPLPEAEVQVRQIRDVYGPTRSAAYVGADATEAQFKRAAPRYAVLHLATHGILDEASPLYSYLVLSMAHESLDDGRLEAWEIMRLKLEADLVVLAACDTGRGRIAPGEGVIGMMWALFAAGARSMVVSQIRVESKSAASLLVPFHRGLADGRSSKAAGLRAAALEMLRTPRYAHPYYWAGFILVGDPG
jgi:CHAT domain-containing protein/tetratricopeptide (TPR) repeat protein